MIRFRSFPGAAILAFIFGSAWLVIGASRAKPAAPRSEKKAVIGYVFARKGRLPDDPIRGDLLTHINYAFANIKNGQLSAEKPDDAENLKALTSLRTRFPQLKVLISVGGWTWSGGFSEMSLSRASRKKFIDSAVAFVRQHDLDGIDLDWEYPGLPGAGNPHRPQDRRNFTLLLGELRRGLNITQKPAGKRYLLTIAAGASIMDTHAGGTQGPRRRISGSPMRAGW
jgi:chitinase